MASTRAFLALALAAMALIASVEAARELRGAQDIVITNCRTYGTFPERLSANQASSYARITRTIATPT